MAIKVTRKEKESPQSLVQRFTKIVRESGILLEARKRQFQDRNKSELKKKLSALRRIQIEQERKKAEKLGKVKK